MEPLVAATSPDDQEATIREQPRPSCPARTAAGEPCRGRVLDDADGRCFAHTDRLADRRAAGRVEGGRNRATAARAYRGLPDPVRETVDGLRDVFAETRAGTIEPARAQALASVARALLAAWEIGVVEDRLETIEAQLQAATTQPTRSAS